VIPAHDEEGSLPRLLESLARQEPPGRVGSVLVVADHCSDATAEVARRYGVEVLERDDGVAGKPPALHEGSDLLRGRPGRADAVVFLDGDCVVGPRFAAAMAARLGPGDSAVQAAYTLDEPEADAVRSGLRRGFALRNVVRANGADRLGVPCVLFGSGMLFRWDVLDHMSFGDPRIDGTGDSRPVADDVLMALDLLAAGIPVRFAAEASVVAPTPGDDRSLGAQRLRWEGGQALMWRRIPHVAGKLLRRGDIRGLVALVDWTAPPLVPTAVAFTLLAGAAVTGVVAGALPAWTLVAPAGAAGALVAYLVIGIGILEGPRAAVLAVAQAPRFVVWKLGLYRRHRVARRPGEEHRATSG
jgi:hypothetical protein